MRKDAPDLELKLKNKKEIAQDPQKSIIDNNFKYQRSEKELRQEIGILKFKLEEEKKRSQELLNQKSAADAKTQQLENEAR